MLSTHVHTISTQNVHTLYNVIGTNTPHSQISCLPSPAWTKRPRTLDPRPWLCQLKPRQSNGVYCSRRARECGKGGEGAGVVSGLGWFSQPTSRPSFSPLSPAAGYHGLPAWPLSLCGSRCAHGTHTPVSRHPCIRSHSHSCADVHTDTAAHFSSLKNTEPSKAGP